MSLDTPATPDPSDAVPTANGRDPPSALIGRRREQLLLAAQLDGARAGTGSALLLRGEPGIGKSALCHHVALRAEEFRLLRTRGLESESGVPFLALRDLLQPLFQYLDRLPEAQADALAGVLGPGPPAAVDRHLLASSILELLVLAAEERPVLLIVDDTHWLDLPSAEALAFAARRLRAQRVAFLIVAWAEPLGFDATGLREVRIRGIESDAARALLLHSVVEDPAPEVVERLLEAAAGNPLALIELPRALSTAQLRGIDPLSDPLPVSAALSAAFERKLRALPARAHAALTVAACAGPGETGTLARALRDLDLDLDALEPAEDAGLIEIAQARLRFRDPLQRSVAYYGAPAAARRRAHKALSETMVEDTEQRAWHLAAASVEPSSGVADELELAADAARERGAHIDAALFLERAAGLTPSPPERARLLLTAAGEAQLSDRVDRASICLEQARAASVGMRSPDDAQLGRSGDEKGTKALYREAIERARADARLAALPTLLIGLGELKLRLGAWDEAMADLAEAASLGAERSQDAVRATSTALIARIEAARGSQKACREHLAEAEALAARLDAHFVAAQTRATKGLLELGLGNLDAAVAELECAARDATDGGIAHPEVVPYEPDLIEAYWRRGQANEANGALAELEQRAERSRSPWAKAVALRCRGMVTPGAEFEACLLEALRAHARAPSRFDVARTELCLGERLRRERRRTDARPHLRASLEAFEALGAEPWADRARAELGATAETIQGRDADLDLLTPQELQVALVVAAGATNKGAAATLFVSPRTIEAHLQHIYRKLGLRSRHQLAVAVAPQQPTDEPRRRFARLAISPAAAASLAAVVALAAGVISQTGLPEGLFGGDDAQLQTQVGRSEPAPDNAGARNERGRGSAKSVSRTAGRRPGAESGGEDRAVLAATEGGAGAPTSAGPGTPGPGDVAGTGTGGGGGGSGGAPQGPGGQSEPSGPNPTPPAGNAPSPPAPPASEPPPPSPAPPPPASSAPRPGNGNGPPPHATAAGPPTSPPGNGPPPHAGGTGKS